MGDLNDTEISYGSHGRRFLFEVDMCTFNLSAGIVAYIGRARGSSSN